MFGRSPFIQQDSIYLDASLDQLMNALDQFYRDYRNENVFIVWALQIVSLEIRGTSPAIVESSLATMRRRAAQARSGHAP